MASGAELLDLLQMSTAVIQHTYLVIGGIDECEDNARLVRDYLGLCKSASPRIIIFGWPNVVSLRRSIKDSHAATSFV